MCRQRRQMPSDQTGTFFFWFLLVFSRRFEQFRLLINHNFLFSMQHSYGQPMPPQDHSVVYHYHYHYVIKQQEKHKLSKVGSHDILRTMKLQHQDSDKQSCYSQQSWKKLINPAFQTEQACTVRAFKSTSPNAKTSFNLKLSQMRSNQKNGCMTPKAVTKRQRTNPHATLKNKQQESQELRENSFGEVSQQRLSNINPENLEKSTFFKKGSFTPLEDLPQSKQPPFEGKSTKISAKEKSSTRESEREQGSANGKEQERPSEYGYALLKQQAKYLRRTFLKYYIKNHLLKEHQK